MSDLGCFTFKIKMKTLGKNQSTFNHKSQLFLAAFFLLFALAQGEVLDYDKVWRDSVFGSQDVAKRHDAPDSAGFRPHADRNGLLK